MAAVSFGAVGLAIDLLYETVLNESRERLDETARTQAQLIEALASDHEPAQILSLLDEAQRQPSDTGEGEETVVASRQGESIIFLLAYRDGERVRPPSIPFDDALAEPARRGLRGESGTMIGPDYRGRTVIAAYEPVNPLGWVVVSKVDLDQVRGVFLRTATVVSLLALGAVVLGAFLFVRLTDPLVKQVEESEKQFRAVFNQTFQFLWLLDPEGRLVDANQAALDAIGVVPMAMQGRLLWQTRWWGELPAQQELLHAAVAEAAGGSFVRREMEMRGFGDRRLILDFSLKPLTDTEGRVVQLLAEGRDITERLRAEETRNRLAAILEATSDFVGLCDPEGRPTYVNRAGRTMLGLADEEDISRTSIRDFIPEWAQKIVIEEAIPAALEKGVWSGETAILRRDGQEISVSQVVIAPPTSRGQAPYLATIVRDLSERKRWEAELAQRTAFLHALIENSPLGVVVLDSRNRITLCNPAFERVFQYREEEIVGLQLDSFVASPEALAEAAEVTRRASEGEVIHTSSRRQRRDGSLVEVEIYGVPLMVKGERRGAFAIYQDITERRRHEAERERLVEALQEALASVKTLRGLLPICASCKKIRDDGGYWSQIETYLRAHSEAEFSHGICPECAKQLYPDQFARMFPELAGDKPAKE